MKRNAALFVLLLLIAALFSAAGCGSEEQQAKQYMNDGDRYLQEYESKVAGWSDQIESLSADPATIVGEVANVKTAGTELIQALSAARTEYEKILKLDGVPEYREYAELRINEVDVLAAMVTEMHGFLDERAAMVSSEDLSFYPALQQRIQNELDPLVEQGRELSMEAERLKSDSGL